jgi:hypothetical protein
VLYQALLLSAANTTAEIQVTFSDLMSRPINASTFAAVSMDLGRFCGFSL